MNSMSLSGEKVILKFNTKIYPQWCIEKTALDFSGSFWITMDGQQGGDIIIILTPKEKVLPDEKIGLDFFNRLIANVKNR